MKIIVVGASAGGVEALQALVGALAPDIDAAVFVVLHVGAGERSMLPSILNRAGRLPAHHAEDNELIERGSVYVAPPNYHMLLERGRVRLSRGPRENRQRPAVDTLFRTAAAAYGPSVLGVVLSGSGQDGSVGAIAIKDAGGQMIVQDAAEALHRGMPSSTLTAVAADAVLPVAAIGRLLNDLAARQEHFGRDDMVESNRDVDAEAMDSSFRAQEVKQSEPSQFSCPECGGVLWEVGEDGGLHFRCRWGIRTRRRRC